MTNLEHVILLGLALTLLVAGCSLAITVGGSIVDRRRPFTLMRLGGTPISVLRRVVSLESAVPLLVASTVAAVVGAGVSIELVKALLPKYEHAAYPGLAYYLTLFIGVGVAMAVTLASLPLLARVTAPETARFE